MRDLSEIRKEIDEIDDKLIDLFKRRMNCAKEVGYYKKERGIPVLNQQREDEILDSVQEKGGEYGSAARLLFADVMELSRAMQHNIIGGGDEIRQEINRAKERFDTEGITVAYQGIKGANSYEAMCRLFPDAAKKSCKTFEDVFKAVDCSNATFGILPVENSTAGSVSAVYDLILKHRFYIVGALDMHINHCLAGLRQSELSDIEIVWSHPQALSQCEGYIAKHNLTAVSKANTAVAARDAAREKRLNVAAICTPEAAKEYGLKILDTGLQDNPYNTTRFIVISKELYIPRDANKISLCFSLPHVKGSLYNLLCRFNSLGLNLTKIESRPAKGKDFEYIFYLDFTGSVYSDSVIELLSRLSAELPEFSFLGNYKE